MALISKHVVVYQINVTDDVIKSKLLFAIYKERNGFRAQVLEQKVFECAEIARWHCCNGDKFNTVFDN